MRISMTGICHECGKRLCDTHVDGTVGGNPVKYHHTCAKGVSTTKTAIDHDACPLCHDTGDVTNLAGEWLRICPCEHGDHLRTTQGNEHE